MTKVEARKLKLKRLMPLRQKRGDPSINHPKSMFQLSGVHYMGDCQNYGPILGPYYNKCRIIIGTQKGTIILTITHIVEWVPGSYSNYCGPYSSSGLGFRV